MRTQSMDTSLEAEREQIELLRKASPAKKFGFVNSLSRTMIEASRRNLRRPGLACQAGGATTLRRRGSAGPCIVVTGLAPVMLLAPLMSVQQFDAHPIPTFSLEKRQQAGCCWIGQAQYY